LSTIQAFLAKLWARVKAVFGVIHPESVELLSIGYAVSWVLPLSVNPWFMGQSPFLVTIEQHLPRPALFVMCFCLLSYQFIALLMGGEPHILDSDRRRARLWLWARLCGQLMAAGIWFFLALLLAANGVLTPGTVQYVLVAIACAGGVWRFYYLICKNRNVEKEIRLQYEEAGLQLVKG
jgi:hypothetical protein